MAFREGRDIPCSLSASSLAGCRQAYKTASAALDTREVPALEPPHVRFGTLVTTRKPSNAELLEQMRSTEPPVQMVCRRMNFTNGIPAEYKWVTREISGFSTFRVQKLTPDEWLAAVAREKASGTGHIGPAVVEEANERGENDGLPA